MLYKTGMKDEFKKAAQRQIWLVRHGSNEEAGDDGDPPLSAQGVAEIGRMAQFLAARDVPGPVLILSSQMLRNRQTAQIIEDRLAGAGKKVRRFAGEAVSGGVEDIVALLVTISNLDNMKETGFPNTAAEAAGTLVLVGNKRNVLLEMLRTIIDPRAEIARLRGDGTRPEDVDMAYVDSIREDEEKLAAYLGGEAPRDVFAKAHLAGFELVVSAWAECFNEGFGRLIEDRSFADPAETHSLIFK